MHAGPRAYMLIPLHSSSSHSTQQGRTPPPCPPHPAGSYYYFGDEKLGQGRERAVASVEDSGELRQRLEAATRASMSASAVPVEDVQAGLLPDDDAMAEFEEELEAMIN